MIVSPLSGVCIGVSILCISVSFIVLTGKPCHCRGMEALVLV